MGENENTFYFLQKGVLLDVKFIKCAVYLSEYRKVLITFLHLILFTKCFKKHPNFQLLRQLFFEFLLVCFRPFYLITPSSYSCVDCL